MTASVCVDILMSIGHVNNVTYNRCAHVPKEIFQDADHHRYAESGRVEWAANYATSIDRAHSKEWSELWTPTGDGMILRSIRTDFKFVSTRLSAGLC